MTKLKKKLAIWGASGHALVVAEMVRLQKEYELVGFLDDTNIERKNKQFLGLPVYDGEQLDELKDLGVNNMILGFGDCQARLKLHSVAKEKGFSFITAIHPNAVVSQNVEIGEGSVIAAGAVVNPGSKIGCNVIVNTCASVDHECVVKDGAHVCPGVHLGGRVTIGRGTWIGIGTTVTERVKIGDHSIIGAGSLVLRDTPSKAVAYGVPAKVRRQNDEC